MDQRSKLLVAACLIFSILGWLRPEFPGRGQAEEAGAGDAKQGGRPTRIALVDLAKVFEKSNEFATAKQVLKERVESIESEWKPMAEELTALKNELKQLDPGSDAYKELVAKIKNQTKAFDDFKKRMQTELSKKEAEIYEQIITVIREQVQRYAEANGIDLVIRFVDQDPDSRTKLTSKELTRSLNAMVVYQSRLDITEAIIEAVNHR